MASLLSGSDYVILKLSDLEIQLKTQQITQDEYDEQLTKYQPILHQRKQIRDWEAEVKKRIKEATDLETLRLLEQEIENYTGG